MGKLLYSSVLLLCFAGLVRSQYCKLADVPVQENFNEKKGNYCYNVFASINCNYHILH